MFQVHPLDVNGKLLRRFYEPLILLSVLDPTRGAQRPDLITERGLDEPSKLWRNFLDQISWLCHSGAGGDTVTAVAAQKTVDHPCFWVAANSRSRHKAREHIAWLFEQLNRLCTDTSVSKSQVEEAILARCIAFSAQRVRAYVSRLLQAFRKAKRDTQGGSNPDDEILLKGLHEFEKLETDPLRLCTFAYDARRHEFLLVLSRRHHAHSSRGIWSDIRHYIGRLGSWTKAVRVVVQGALRFPQRIENAQIKVVEPSGLVDRPNADHLTDFNSLLRRMLPAHQESLAEELSQVLTSIDAMAGIKDRFHESYSNMRPRPHAELLVLEHFHSNKFEFVADDRYIGCSKPSCYCCHLYTQLHPGGFAPRPCHGNLWINWAPPAPLPLITSPRKKGSRPQEHHTFRMLQEMVPRIRQDLQEQISSKRPKRAKLPDSTTGMSSVILVLQEGLAEDLVLTGSDVVANATKAPVGNDVDTETSDVAPGSWDQSLGEHSSDETSRRSMQHAGPSGRWVGHKYKRRRLSGDGSAGISDQSILSEREDKEEKGEQEVEQDREDGNGDEDEEKEGNDDDDDDGDDFDDEEVLLFKGRRALRQ